MKATGGQWRPGKGGGTVVTDLPISGIPIGTGHSDTEYYGGYLICESIWRKEDQTLITAAPDLYAALRSLVIHANTEVGPIPEELWQAADRALDKAEGKGEADRQMTEQQITAVARAESAVFEAIAKLERARHLLVRGETAPIINDRIKDTISKLDDIAEDLDDYPARHTVYMGHLASLGFTWKEDAR